MRDLLQVRIHHGGPQGVGVVSNGGVAPTIGLHGQAPDDLSPHQLPNVSPGELLHLSIIQHEGVEGVIRVLQEQGPPGGLISGAFPLAADRLMSPN